MKNLRKKIEEITEGWQNWVIKDPIVEKEAEKRALICHGCPERNKVLNICSICTCPLQVKTRSGKSICPHPDGNKW